MAFGSSTQKKTNQEGSGVEQVYLKLGTGERLIRILDQEETVYWRYFLNVNAGGRQSPRSLVVATNDNPIQKYMNSLGKDHPNYRAIQRRMLLNVLDRSLVKKTSQGMAIYSDEKGIYPSTDPATGENLSQSPVQPNDKVLILDFGSTLMEQFMLLHERIRHRQTFEPLPVWRFDIRIVSRGIGKDVTRMAMPDGDQDELPIDLLLLPKYDLTQVIRPIPNEHLQRLLDGEDYNEVIRSLGFERPVATVSQ